ncbi:LysR family transcriptional regulator [Atopococcus tabaci]|uniref:LysR family transcriptional regulator n=1 Tax=Atopococcus tabaci TaxID=269774 RepID=UPI002409EF94|nr:LysR family transcriptional regulator [Atopococcus tabaci]
MDITQMHYLIAIVESGCNLSAAAKKIHISQSALSQFITNFERDEEVALFVRKNGRLEELTPSGKRIYEYALNIVRLHEEMEEMVRKEASKQKGTIRIGMPSLVLTVLFSHFFSKFIVENPDIKIEIVEEGSNELKRMLYEKDLDYVAIVAPTELDPKSYEEHVIQIDEYTAFMRPEHALAEKEIVRWEELAPYQIGTFRESFVTYRLVNEKLKEKNSKAKVTLTAASWDFLVETTNESDFVSILPAPIQRYLHQSDVIMKHFEDPIPFNVLLCRPRKEKYSTVESFVHESMLNYFYQPVD